jgi:hypothetical protein
MYSCVFLNRGIDGGVWSASWGVIKFSNHCLRGCEAVYFCMWVPKLWKNLLPFIQLCRQKVSPNNCYPSAILHDIISQETITLIFKATGISNLKILYNNLNMSCSFCLKHSWTCWKYNNKAIYPYKGKGNVVPVLNQLSTTP